MFAQQLQRGQCVERGKAEVGEDDVGSWTLELGKEGFASADAAGAEAEASFAQLCFDKLGVLNDVLNDEYVEFLLHSSGSGSSSP